MPGAMKFRGRSSMRRRIAQMVVTTAIIAGCNKAAAPPPPPPPPPPPGPGPSGVFGDGPPTVNYLKGLHFTPAGSLFAMYPCATCPNGQISLLISPEENAKTVSWQGSIIGGRPGDVVAVVVNADIVAFPELKLEPGDTAYAWVGQIGPNGTPNNRGFGVYRLDTNGYSIASWSVVPYSKIKHCQHATPWARSFVRADHPGPEPCNPIQPGVASIDWKSGLAGLGVSEAYGATTRAASSAFLGLGKLWITCTGGCCQVSTT
jgi:hypothetical protein